MGKYRDLKRKPKKMKRFIPKKSVKDVLVILLHALTPTPLFKMLVRSVLNFFAEIKLTTTDKTKLYLRCIMHWHGSTYVVHTTYHAVYYILAYVLPLA